MNIAVCIKQVPDTTEIKIDPQTNTLIREGVESIINPFDLYALEEALRIKEAHGGNVTIISMGPAQVESALREALAIGADEIILLSDRKFAGSDTLATSLTLARGLEKSGPFDMIFCGQQAIDGDTAQVGPGIAAHLQIPQVCFVRKIEEIANRKITLQRLMEDGYDRITVDLPVVLSVVKEINEPRLPSLRGKKRAKTVTMKILNAKDLELDEKVTGLNGSPTQVIKIFSPKHDKSGEKIEENPEVLADIFIDKLKSIQF